ncbi:MAG: DUF58 domain-containing protein [Candidatus Pacearchaeota archaeon]
MFLKSMGSNYNSNLKGKFLINFPTAVNEFEKILQKFPIKKILYKTIFRGKGLEFDAYKTFEQNDDASVIDWKASLRSNEILVKKYVEERDLNIYFILDVSSSMLFGSGDKLKSEYAAELIAALGHLILGSGDRTGLIMFSEKIVKILYPSGGKNQFFLFTKFLSDVSLYGGGCDLNEAIEFALQHVKTSHNVFIIISDFISANKRIERNLVLLGSKYETMAIILRDPMDESLPKNSFQLAIQDPFSSNQMILDTSIAYKRYRESVVYHKKMLSEILKKSRIDSLELTIDKPFAIPLVSFLKRRAMGKGRI